MSNAPPSEEVSGEDRQRVELLLIEISTRFINLPTDEVDREIQSAQCRICTTLDLDRSALWQAAAEDPDSQVLTHMYQRAAAPAVPMRVNAREFFPWVQQQVRSGRTVALANMDDLPAEAARDREAFRQAGTQATLIVPLSLGGETLGALTFASLRPRPQWPEPLVRRLQLLAEVFTNAIARTRSDRALRATRERYALAVDGANDGLWDWDMLTDAVYFSPRWKQMLGYADHDVANRFAAWEELLHPEDRARALAALQAHLSGQNPIFELEHRLRQKDGTYRWVRARGKALRDAAGCPYRMAGSHSDINAQCRAEEKLRESLAEVQRLREQLQFQNVYLQQELKELKGHGRLVGDSQALRQVLAQVEEVAPTNATVLVLGETGTGKELVAAAIHESSARRELPMVRVNCSAIPGTLIESELFGREKGAYTGAVSKQIGRFELANGSTIFLDEIADLPAEMQVKLLRVLENRRIERLGSPKSIPVNVRIIAATNRALDKALREGSFREDLYYRLNVFPIVVPPLRERLADIPKLVSMLVNEFSAAMGREIVSVARESIDALQRYDWPGNVRELRNVVERAMIRAHGPKLWIEAPGRVASSVAPSSLSMHEVDRKHVLRVLDMSGWRIRGKHGAAEILGLKPTTLENRMAKLGIRRPAPTSSA